MRSYTVKQIAEMLDTNPETVRRWIRDNKLKAVQVSRKTGNIVTEDELQRFINTSPKYFPRFAAGIAMLSPVVGIAALAGGFVASALLDFFDEKSKSEVQIHPDDFKEYLQNQISKLNDSVAQKQELIRQTGEEIMSLKRQIEQYAYLLDNEGLLTEAMEKANAEQGG